MDKNAIKKYAVWARRELISRVSQRALIYGISSGEIQENADSINGKLLTRREKSQRAALISRVKQIGYEQVIEEVAYTWFNRFCALRFMEVNGYLPSHVRVFTDENNAFNPQILTETLHIELEGLNKEIVFNLKEKNQTEELYKYLLIVQCNALNSVLPVMFQKIEDYTELLFPDNILRQGSVVEQLVSQIPEEDFNIRSGNGQVEIIGWLYQYYITELNELVYDGNMSKNKVTKELLPAATTIYTPDWVVKYMVQNSLGKYWQSSHNDSELKSNWKYYLENNSSNNINLNAVTDPKGIKILDPCMGSGHILIYAFDVLMQIYQSCGYNTRDSVKSILENNLYGIDIDNRAAQLAYFAIMMKARMYDSRIFSRNIQPHIYAVLDSNNLDSYAVEYFINSNTDLKNNFEKIIETLNDAKEYGSIIKMPQIDYVLLNNRINEINNDISLYKNEVLNSIVPLIKFAEALSCRYDIVITNPPYLGSLRFSGKLDSYVKKHYADVKADLSMVMYKHSIEDLAKRNGYVAFITTTSWMFLSSFEKLRNYIQNNVSIVSLVDFGTELFDGKVGHNPIVSWVTQVGKCTDSNIIAIRLVDYCYSRRDEKEPEFFNLKNRYLATQSNFSKIPGSPIAYWVSEQFINGFRSKRLGDYVELVEGIHTRDNDQFLRLWQEVDFSKSALIDFSRDKKWYGYNKGGMARQWYGNNEYVVDWESDGKRIKNFSKASIGSCNHFFEEGITFTFLTSSINTFRYSPYGNLYDFAGPTIYPYNHSDFYPILGVLATKISNYYLKVINPTINMPLGDVKKFPVNFSTDEKKKYISKLVVNNVNLSKFDWNSYETSWDFKKHSLI